MSYFIDSNVKSLLESIRPVLTLLLSSSASSGGDIVTVESFLGTALSSIRSLSVQAAIDAADSSLPSDYFCPGCSGRMGGWGRHKRSIMTLHGECLASVRRYRCRACSKNVFPILTLNGLDDTCFTIGARHAIAEEAAEGSFARTAHRMAKLGISISASEVERISDSVGTWREEEEEAIRAFAVLKGQDLGLPIHDIGVWERFPSDAAMVVSVDGAKIRSNVAAGDATGMQWFEVRAASISLNGEHAPKICIAGDMSPDKLFETTWSQVRQLKCGTSRKIVFVADGANWIWDRVQQWFPSAIQVLDIYHAGEHVASAAKAAWGEDHPEAKLWATQARNRLLQADGVKTIMRELANILQSGSATDEKLLRTELNYLWKNRHRMKYAEAHAQGLPIGSGVMESTIKQTSTHRLRQSGMKWTRDGANVMLRLRAAIVSDSLKFTTNRQQAICKSRLAVYQKAI
jgi:hypothetical protein